jgi:phage repressor protein C with HTH and peptisase S24 domain
MKSKSKVSDVHASQGQSTGQTSPLVLSTGDSRTIGERIVEARGSRTQDEYADLLKVSKGTLGRYERNERDPDVDFMNSLSAKGDVNPTWLLHGIEPRSFMQAAGGEPDKVWEKATVGQREQSIAMTDKARYGPSEDFVLIPLYDIRVAAGHGALVDGREPSEHWAFSRVWLERELRVPPVRLVLVTVAGNSMIPDLYDGDVIMIDTGDIDVLREGAYVFRLDGHVFVKGLELKGDQLVIKSRNHVDHPDETVRLLQENSTFQLYGRVLGKPVFVRF